MSTPLTVATYLTSPTIMVYQRLLEEVYAQAGVEIVYRQIPVLRALQQASDGKLDAVLIYSRDIALEVDNLVRVDEPLPPLRFRLMALSSFPETTLTPTLGDYRVGHIQGIRFLEQQLRQADTTAAQNGYTQLISLLRHRRIDLVAIGEWDALPYLENSDEFKLYEQPVFSDTLYHFVNRRHQRLAAALADALEAAKKSGCVDQIIRHVIAPKLKPPEPDDERICKLRHGIRN